jgi:hypothetical protein
VSYPTYWEILDAVSSNTKKLARKICNIICHRLGSVSVLLEIKHRNWFDIVQFLICNPSWWYYLCLRRNICRNFNSFCFSCFSNHLSQNWLHSLLSVAVAVCSGWFVRLVCVCVCVCVEKLLQWYLDELLYSGGLTYKDRGVEGGPTDSFDHCHTAWWRKFTFPFFKKGRLKILPCLIRINSFCPYIKVTWPTHLRTFYLPPLTRKDWQLVYMPQGLTISISTFCPCISFVCFVWISEPTTLISLCVTNMYNVQNYNFACCFVWVWNLVCLVEGGTLAESVRE